MTRGSSALTAPALASERDEDLAQWFWALVRPDFPAEIGFDRALNILQPPPDHPLLGWSECRVRDCDVVVLSRGMLCTSCGRRLADSGLAEAEFVALPRPDGRRRRSVRNCLVQQCERPWVDAPRALCSSHHYQRTMVIECSLEEYLARTDLVPLSSLGPCSALACVRQAGVIKSMLCHAHNCRLLDDRRTDPNLDLGLWRTTQTPIPEGAEVSFRGLPDLVVAQLIYGIQQRCADGALTTHHRLRNLTAWLRRQHTVSFEGIDPRQAVAGGMDRLTRGPLTTITTAVRRARLTPEGEYPKDRWDLTAFGHSGTIDFSGLTQSWLKETAKRWARHTAPQARGEKAGGNLRKQVRDLGLLSQSLRARPDRGDFPQDLGREDIEFFLNRLTHLHATGRISAYHRRHVIYVTGNIIKRMRSLGLTQPGEPMHGLSDNFTMIRGDLPAKPERNESGQDLPAEVMRRLCAELGRIEERSGPESRVGIELLIDTGRRPDEICELSFDCLELDGDGKPLLIYDNRKEDRPRRELPLHESTAAVIRNQQQSVRARFPGTPARDLKLLPSPIRNPRGEKAISESTLSTNTRIWVDALSEITLDNGSVFDKTKIFPYAFRHTYAQRHADAGVPVDVLSKLLDHDTLEATRGYYRVKEKRLRQAVDKVARLQFDRHGSRTWQQAKAVLEAQRSRRSIGEVAVAFGRCSEPTNVTAGGGQCPLRFRCLGCDHFSTDVSYLPELRSYLDDLLRTRERLSAMSSADDWAKREAMPSDEEISRVRRLIRRVTEDLGALTEQERSEIEEAVATVRKTRQGFLGMPRIRQPLPDVRPERP
ncbi:tyrosine-type recombinase/integrase [Kitasatospora sp. NPDC087314]|uniref:tyrosine-type recombinase/integrase n=1 Tax=Kitasatospora sp. NPDC087314 TaxID=3364068 RepID=UPI0037F16D14